MKFRTKDLTYIAIMTALTAVATMVIQIPVPATNGYINIGDSIIFITAALLGPIPAMVAGGIGSSIADVLGGYSHWAVFTLIIKGAEGLVCGLLCHMFFKKTSTGVVAKIFSIISMTVATVVMVAGYFFGGWILKGSAIVSATSIPANVIQGVVSIVIAFLVLFIMKLALKINAKSKSTNK